MGILNFFKKRNNDLKADADFGMPLDPTPPDLGNNPFEILPNTPPPGPNFKGNQKVMPPDFSNVPELEQKDAPRKIEGLFDQLSQRQQLNAKQEPLKTKSSLGLPEDSEMVVEFGPRSDVFSQLPSRTNPNPPIPPQNRQVPRPAAQNFGPPETKSKAFLFSVQEPAMEKAEGELPEFEVDDLNQNRLPESSDHKYEYDEELFLPKKHVFINVKDHQDILMSFAQINARIDQHIKGIDRVEYLIDAKEGVYSKLKFQIEDVQRKLVLVDKVLFEDNPYFNSY